MLSKAHLPASLRRPPTTHGAASGALCAQREGRGLWPVPRVPGKRRHPRADVEGLAVVTPTPNRNKQAEGREAITPFLPLPAVTKKLGATRASTLALTLPAKGRKSTFWPCS